MAGTFRNTSDYLGRLLAPKDPIALGEQLTIAAGLRSQTPRQQP